MTTRQEPLASRLWRDMAGKLAVHVGCCPIHGGRLICAICDVTSRASPREQAELEGLIARTPLYQRDARGEPTCPVWPCGRCHAENIALCLDCYEPVADQMFAGLTPAEEARVVELAKKTARFTFMPDPDVTGPGE